LSVRILIGDCREKLRELSDASVNCCVTSPPYFGLRDYGVEGQMGLELTPDEFVTGMVEVFREVRRVLRDDGTLWLNIGDSYAGSWGAQSRGDFTPGTLEGASSKEHCLSARQITAHPKGTRTGSLKNTPGIKAKDLMGIPWMLAFALRADGWYLRQDIIWSKPNPMPESTRDRCTKAHEYMFLLSKSPRYYYDNEAVAEPSCWDPANSKMPDGWDTGEGGHGSFHRQGREKGRRSHLPGNKSHRGADAYADGDEKHRTKVGLVAYSEGVRADPDKANTRNKRSVWTVATAPFSEAHFATYPPALIEPCILAGCPSNGVVLDPFFGAGTTGLVADRLQRDCIGIELNPEYAEIARRRISEEAGMFGEVLAA
jgi:DNA modification methylase